MGFDLYGLNPKINQDYTQRYNEIMKEYGTGDGWIDWQKDIPEDVKEEYFELKSEYEEKNIGYYFRNNVWWWRPLWSFVCSSCDDILTEKDMNVGSYNDGHKISKTKATRIGKRLSKLLADGTVHEICKEHELERAKSKAYNEMIEEQLNDIKSRVKLEHGDGKVPATYPEPFKTEWEKTYAKKKWSAEYPIDAGNIEDFAKFCLESGGFEIC